DTSALWRVPISTKTWQISQAPERLTFGTDREEAPSISGNGRLAFASLSENTDIWSLPIDSDQPRARGELQRLTEDAAPDLYPFVTPDGRQLIYTTSRAGKRNIWMKNIETGHESPLTTDGAPHSRPILAASRLVYETLENQKSSAYWLDLSADGRPA